MTRSESAAHTRIDSEVDILIIGGGVAGMYAALKAHEQGANVLVVSKGPIGRSGGTVFAGTLVAYMDPTTLGYPSREESEQRWMHLDKYYWLMDGNHLLRSAEFVRDELLPDLERMGLYFRRLPDGRLLHNPTKPKHTWTPSMGMSGRAIGDILRRRVLDARIPVLEETMATSLLVSDGRCAGATLLRIMDGEFMAVRAKATILATGHANFLSKRSTATREICGDGLALPHRAGAELFNIEMQEWHVTDMVWPRAWTRLHIYPNPMPATTETSKLISEDGKVLFEQKSMPRINKPYHHQHRIIYEHAKANSIPYADYKNGGYYSDLTHIDPYILDEYSYQTQFPQKLGIDPTSEHIENAPTYHYIVGGVWVDFVSMESKTLPLLYAAGGAAGRDGQTDCMYDGKCAAEAAIAAVSSVDMPNVDMAVLEEEQRRVLGLLHTADEDGIRPIAVKNAIREIMWERMDYVKTEAKMQGALDAIEEIRQEMAPKMALTTGTRRYNYDWVDGLDVTNMLDACRLQIMASLRRKESRGPFFRQDYPYQDNENWQRYVIVGSQAGSVHIREEPVVHHGLSLPAVEQFLQAAE